MTFQNKRDLFLKYAGDNLQNELVFERFSDYFKPKTTPTSTLSEYPSLLKLFSILFKLAGRRLRLRRQKTH